VSIHVLSWVLTNSEATLGDRLVAIVLANHAHDDGDNAFASVETLAAEARVDRRTIQRSLRSLESLGEIEATGRRPSGAVVYRFPKYAGGRHIAAPGGGVTPLRGRQDAAVGAAQRRPIRQEPSVTTSGGTLPPLGGDDAPPCQDEAVVDRWLSNVGVEYAHDERTFREAVADELRISDPALQASLLARARATLESRAS